MTEAEPKRVPERTEATMHKGRWPGWIWGVPIAAIAIVLWLVIREITLNGITAHVTYDRANGIKEGDTEVQYRGIKVGKVDSVSLSHDNSHVIVKLNIQQDVKQLLRKNTRFYLEGAHPSLSNLGSLKAIIAGPTIDMVPGDGPPARNFTGIAGPAPTAMGVAVPYIVHFGGDVGALDTGAPVLLRGFKVGEVSQVGLSVDRTTGLITTRVLITLDPLRLHLSGEAPANHDWQSVTNEALAALISRNLRARLTKSPPIIGSPQIELATVPGAPAATLAQVGSYYEIPTATPDGMSRAIQEAGNLPIKEIGDNIKAITANIKSLSASPKLKDSISNLDSALATLNRTLKQAGPEVAPTIKSVHQTVDALRQTAKKLDQAVDSAKQVMGETPAAPDGSLQPALLHISEAARSIRALADFLDEHPETLIRGRK